MICRKVVAFTTSCLAADLVCNMAEIEVQMGSFLIVMF